MKSDMLNVLDGELPQVIVFAGDDFIGREKALEKILEKLRTQYKGLIEERFDSTLESFEEYIERIITPSLFQEVRLFHVRHAQGLNEKDLDRFRTIIGVQLVDVFVIIEYESKSGRGKKTKSVVQKLDMKNRVKKEPKKFTILQFDKPPDYKLATWLMTQVPLLFNRDISKSGAESLIDLAGNELDRLYTELQKLDIHLPDDAPISKESIESVTGATRQMTPFELARALGQKDLPRILEIIDSLFKESFYAPTSIAIIFKHFWNIFKIRAYATENRNRANAYFKARYTEQTKIAFEIGVATGMLSESDSEKKAYPVMVLSGVIDQAVKYKNEHFNKIFNWLKEFDVGVKTGKVIPTKQTFQLLCYNIVRVAEIEEKESLSCVVSVV